MKEGKSALARWRLLHTALMWARKGCDALKHKLQIDLSLRARGHPYKLYYGEREMSFDETPTFHFTVHRPRFPCIDPRVDGDEEDGSDDDRHHMREKKYYFLQTDMREEHSMGDSNSDGRVENEIEEEGGIDSKAEEFIVKFYEQMKLQRQVSVLQYNEMLRRGMS